MMGICPLCNALESQTYSCQNCQGILQDYGKTVDYIDDYSAYMDQELLSAVDGLTHNNSQEYCNHVFYCGVCNVETEVVVKVV